MARQEALCRGAIAACRFGLGARPGEIAETSHDPRGRLLAQLEPAAAAVFPGVAGSAARICAVRAADKLDPAGAGLGLRWILARDELATRAHHAASTPHGFRERWAMFWLNHFALQANGGQVEMLSGSFAREVVDAGAFGRFGDLMATALRHPAMLIALNQSDSVGPDSPVGRATGRGVNENLAREAMELHSIGAGGGYRQADVSELALALAGWTVGDPDGPLEGRGRLVDDPARRQPGPRRWLGRTWPQADGRAEAMVRELARRPQTHARLAFKVARHFVADNPPPALVARLTKALDGGGSLHGLAATLVEAPEAWAPGQAKFKTPYEHLISAHRAVGAVPDDAGALLDRLTAAGHSPMWAPSPKGASDSAQAWVTPLALAQRADLARSLASRSPFVRAADLARSCLGPTLGAPSAAALAASPLEREDAVALVLMCPEFLSR